VFFPKKFYHSEVLSTEKSYMEKSSELGSCVRENQVGSDHVASPSSSMARQPEVEPWPPLNDASKLAYLERSRCYY
jgi:hypothetical protein